MKQVIAVRTDLGMSKGKLAGQVAHAAVRATYDVERDEDIESWEDIGAPKIVVKVKSESEINSLSQKAEEKNIPYSVIQDLGHTELDPDTTTTIGIGPAENEEIDNITGDLSLL